MKAWTFQDAKQQKKLGAKCPWSVGWYHEGRKRQKRIGSKSMATKFARKLEGEAAAGLLKHESRVKWQQFRKEYEEKNLNRKPHNTRRLVKVTLDHFQRLCKPMYVRDITTKTIDTFIERRSLDAGNKPGAKVSPSTVNRDLRQLRAALQYAFDWKYLTEMPKFKKLRAPVLMGNVVTEDHFGQIFSACDSATLPFGLNCEPGDWWRALLMFAITTGWRIEETLLLRREDLDLETGELFNRSGDNKGDRDEVDHLPTLTLEMVKPIIGFGPKVFEWPHDSRTLWVEFARVQKTAGIRLPCRDPREHRCTDACHRYGFHALRRAYATLNADTMPAALLQQKMRHKSFTTTLGYIKLSDKMKSVADRVFVPNVSRPTPKVVG